MGTYTKTGPFTNGSAPGISKAFLDAVENQLVIALTSDGAYTATAPSPLQFASISTLDLTGWGANVASDTQQRIAQYIRHTDNYGGVMGGAGSSITAHLYAQSAGWRITESLTIDTNLTVTGTAGITGLTTATGGISTNAIGAISGNVVFSSNINMNTSTLLTNTIQTVSGSGGMTLACGNSGFFGFKLQNGTKLAEMKNGGQFIAAGAFQTAGGTSTIATAQTFDSFDYAECFVHDQDYPNGTVVCLDAEGRMTRCTHDNCPAALIVSKQPGYMTGEDDTEEAHAAHVHPLALAGRVKAQATDGGVARGSHVVSNGAGGLRALAKNKWGYALGVAITETGADGQVGVLVRPMFCKGA